MTQDEKSRVIASVDRATTPRWTTDPGAIPGEPYEYLDIPISEEGEIGEAKAVIVEIETPGGSRWDARAFGAKSLGMFETAEQARTAAQTYVEQMRASATAVPSFPNPANRRA
jgi:hypothetical protein